MNLAQMTTALRQPGPMYTPGMSQGDIFELAAGVSEIRRLSELNDHQRELAQDIAERIEREDAVRVQHEQEMDKVRRLIGSEAVTALLDESPEALLQLVRTLNGYPRLEPTEATDPA